MKFHRSFIAAILSILFCGLGQIYLKKTSKGIILAITFLLAIAIIWMAITDVELKLFKWDNKQLNFSPSARSITIRGIKIPVTDIMKITGSIQLAIAWIFGVADAWQEGKK